MTDITQLVEGMVKTNADAQRELIATACKKARNAALDEAALIADRMPGHQNMGGENWTADAIARGIRALKTL